MGISIDKSSLTSSPNIIELYKGQSKDIPMLVTKPALDTEGNLIDIPFNLDGCTLFFSVRLDEDSPDILISKVSTDPEQIQILTPFEDGKSVIFISYQDTLYMEPGRYRFDVWVELPNDKRFPVVEPSDFVVKKSITRIAQ